MKQLISTPQLQVIVALAEELHFGRAASRLGIAQPQLSTAVRRIEEIIGTSLFIRRPAVRLTPAGMAVLGLAYRTLRALEEGVEEALAAAAGRMGKVRLGFSAAAMFSDLPEALQSFRLSQPAVRLELKELHSQDLAVWMERGELDLAISRQRLVEEGVHTEFFRADEIRLIAPRGHALADKPVIKLADLRDEDFVFFGRPAAPEYYDRKIKACRAAGLELNVVQEADTWTASLALVRAGFGLTFGTALLAKVDFPEVVVRPLADKMPDVSFWLAHRPAGLSPAADLLLQHLRQTA